MHVVAQNVDDFNVGFNTHSSHNVDDFKIGFVLYFYSFFSLSF